MAEYDASSITVLKGLEPVRRRPGMYVGDTDDGSGLHRLLYAAVERAVDEHVDSECGPSYVCVRFDGDRVSVEDDGDGIPVDYHRPSGKSVLEVLFTALFGGCAVGRRWTRTPSVAVLNALSAHLDVEVRRGGRRYRQSHCCGEPTGPVQDVGPAGDTGTTISFTPDFGILARTGWDRERIAARMREVSVLNPRLTLIVDGQAYRAPNGLADGVRHMARDRRDLAFRDPVRIAGGDAAAAVDVALQWGPDAPARLVAYANHQRTVEGPHIDGLFDGLCAGLSGLSPARLGSVYPTAFREAIERGLIGILHVEVLDGGIGGCLGDRLDSDSARDAVSRVVADAVARDRDLGQALLARLPAASGVIAKGATLAGGRRER